MPSLRRLCKRLDRLELIIQAEQDDLGVNDVLPECLDGLSDAELVRRYQEAVRKTQARCSRPGSAET